MNLHLTGRHLEITPAIRDYATGKIGKIKRHFDNVIDVNIRRLRAKVDDPHDRKLIHTVRVSGYVIR